MKLGLAILVRDSRRGCADLLSASACKLIQN